MQTGAILQGNTPIVVDVARQEKDSSAVQDKIVAGPARKVGGTRPRLAKAAGPSDRFKPNLNAPAVGSVPAQELQSAVLFVLALFASVAVLNLQAELSSILQQWQSFVEFLAKSIF